MVDKLYFNCDILNDNVCETGDDLKTMQFCNK